MMPRGMAVSLVVKMEQEINIISAIRLEEGGAAMLAAHIINHSVDIDGAEIFVPLFISSLRDLELV